MLGRRLRKCNRRLLSAIRSKQKFSNLCLLMVLTCLVMNLVKFTVLLSKAETEQLLIQHTTELSEVHIRVDSNHIQPAMNVVQPTPSGRLDNEVFFQKAVTLQVIAFNRSTCGVFTAEERRKDLKRRCETQIKAMASGWSKVPMYRSQGVDGNMCCIHRYASQIANLCPKRNWFDSFKLQPNKLTIPYEEADLRVELEDLLQILKDPSTRKVFAFARLRVIRNWDNWKQGALNLAKKQNMDKRTRKRILLYPGVMTKKSNINYVENQFRGAPLGEITQWTDLITVLHILGHNLTIATEFEALLGLGQPVERNQKMVPQHTECPAQTMAFDLIYTDIIGLKDIKMIMGSAYHSIKCMLRIVDSFGTEAPYNDYTYALSHHMLTVWGQQNLRLQQFNTLYPHTPENSFLGFVVERNEDEQSLKNLTAKDDIALIYAKDFRMWKNMSRIVNVLHKYLEVHATVNAKKNKMIPKYVVNHGVLPGDRLHKLLKRIKLFVGFPTSPKEGPGPLEAIGYGAVFLNPAYHTPINYNKSKPTSRSIASINPYAEDHIGKPHVYTINMSKLQDIDSAVTSILKANRFEPYMAYEFTHEGMLQRVNSYIVHQDFCSSNSKEKWPPRNVVTFELADSGVSCKEFCWKKGLVCELAYFDEINNPVSVADFCSYTSYKEDDHLYPIRDEKSRNCTLQSNPWLFGCAGSRPSVRRFCPCRTYVKGQSSLCPGCE